MLATSRNTPVIFAEVINTEGCHHAVQSLGTLQIKRSYVANIPNGSSRSETLTGHYVRHGSKLTGPCTLLLVHRSTTTHAKADSYVLLVHPDGRRSYVSSLWHGPTAGTYAMEYRRQRYTVTMTDSTAQVFPEQGGTGYSSVPPVAKSATRSTTGTTSIDTVL